MKHGQRSSWTNFERTWFTWAGITCNVIGGATVKKTNKSFGTVNNNNKHRFISHVCASGDEIHNLHDTSPHWKSLPFSLSKRALHESKEKYAVLVLHAQLSVHSSYKL